MKREMTIDEKNMDAKIKVLSKVNQENSERIKLADKLLIEYNDFIKEEFSYARKLGTNIDEYLVKYDVKDYAP